MTIPYEFVSALIMILTSLAALYAAGVKFGRLSERISATEEKLKGQETIIEMLRSKMSGLADTAAISGMESRLQNQIAVVSSNINASFQHLTERIDAMVSHEQR